MPLYVGQIELMHALSHSFLHRFFLWPYLILLVYFYGVTLSYMPSANCGSSSQYDQGYIASIIFAYELDNLQAMEMELTMRNQKPPKFGTAKNITIKHYHLCPCFRLPKMKTLACHTISSSIPYSALGCIMEHQHATQY